jgi:hypothetical protein
VGKILKTLDNKKKGKIIAFYMLMTATLFHIHGGLKLNATEI